MEEETKAVDESERRREERLSLQVPVEYFFIHVSENKFTKQFRRGQTLNFSRHGVSFDAEVVDRSILPMAFRGEIQIAVRIHAPDGRVIEGYCRLAWADNSPSGEANRFIVGLEYLTFEDSDAKYLFDEARKSGIKGE